MNRVLSLQKMKHNAKGSLGVLGSSISNTCSSASTGGCSVTKEMEQF